MKCIQILIMAMLSLFMSVSLSAQELSINGQKLLVKGLSIRDDNGAAINDSDLEAMTAYGFDLKTWQEIRAKRVITYLGEFSCCLMITASEVVKNSNPDLAASLALGGILVSVVTIIVDIRNTKRFKIWLGNMNDCPKYGYCPQGIGIAYSF